MLPSPSDEQKEILLYFKQGYNVRSLAVAGSGKTTSLLLLALEAETSFKAKTLILTYNRDLKEEIKQRITNLGLNSCNVYTYHGYASRLYKQNICNDVKLRECLKSSTDILNNSPYNVILLDEVQDMNQDYYTLITKILFHGQLLVLVGDNRQCINEYLGATSEYLINYSKYFNTGRPWKELTLRTSYRLTPSIAAFINENILGEEIIVSGNNICHNYKPTYHYGIWDIERLVTSNVEIYGPDEVVILLPSVRNISPKSPIGKLYAKKQSGLLFCIRDNDVANETLQNKILITSYNSMKGRERKCVIIVGFDESYFEYYDRKWPKEDKGLPNILYVAVTRAREKLVLIQDKAKPRFRTIKTDKLYETCDVKGGQDENKDKEKNGGVRDKTYEVTDIIRHRNTTDTLELLELISIETIHPPGATLPYQNIIQFAGYYEDMRQYYGMIISLLAQYKRTGKICLLSDVESSQVINDPRCNARNDVVNRYVNLAIKDGKEIKEWMELVVLQSAIMSKCYFYVYQITHYDWIDEKFINTQVDRILSLLPDEQDIGIFEHPCDIKEPYKLIGIFDYFNGHEIWEFKCSSSLSDENKLQCGAYISIYHESEDNLISCNLYNTRTGELVKLTVNDPRRYLNVLMRNKLSKDI